eukprot:TRINITY_DN1218_c0_g2_i14.p1 TRINITY_DN1218_c0_g2~~TRINITY_DN1218_c0_g2_i14.p1  ORF type:complete len:133 (-),score=13.15 TRINITY_DN1218_c0_g2_i14:396-794(-)
MSRYHAFRLTKGADLKQSLMQYVVAQGLTACIVTCCVGSLSHLHVRLAGAQAFLKITGPFEIVSLTGTLCTTGCHLHISVSKASGEVVGGHLMDGCVIETTAEVVLAELLEWTFKREVDPATGYLELITEKK